MRSTAIALATLVEMQIDAGTHALVPCGSTGESATLTHEEHAEVVREVVRLARGRVPVIAGTGSNSTAEAIRLTRAAEEAGAAGALLISPYYNQPTQEGIYRHYAAVADATKLPLIVYNIPGRTASNIAARDPRPSLARPEHRRRQGGKRLARAGDRGDRGARVPTSRSMPATTS